MKKTLEQIIGEFKNKHGEKFDYSRVVYTNIDTPVEIICPKHGLFRQHAGSHLQGNECPECKREKQFLTTEEFIKRAQAVHGDK